MTSFDEHRYHRQLGLVDQDAVASLRVSLGGDTNLILATLSQLVCAGVGSSPNGLICIQIDPDEKLKNERHSWIFGQEGNETNWSGVAQAIKESHGINIHFGEIEGSTLIECVRGDYTDINADLFATVWHGQAVLSKRPLNFAEPPNTSPTLIDAALEIALGAAVVQRIFALKGVLRSSMISDQWLTLTARADGLMPEDAVKRFSSTYGRSTASMLPDGTGSLVRFRIPMEETPAKYLNNILHDCIAPEIIAEDWCMAVGPFSLEFNEDREVLPSQLELPEFIDTANLLVLGTGGLGSWATPLFSQGVHDNGLHLSIVDADTSVDMHNLNRQVLYTTEEVGMPKAPAAALRMRNLLGEEAIVIPIQNRLEERHTTPELEVAIVSNDGSISLEELVGEENIVDDKTLRVALENMDIALACLDNQFARTMLNRCCITRGVPMINGGGEAFSGIVEVLDEGICMVCRYGKETAFAQEIISCQESGTRPVASIVTTTAWVGANIAALALLELAGIQGHRTGMEWDGGMVSTRVVGALPWITGECPCHG